MSYDSVRGLRGQIITVGVVSIRGCVAKRVFGGQDFAKTIVGVGPGAYMIRSREDISRLWKSVENADDPTQGKRH